MNSEEKLELSYDPGPEFEPRPHWWEASTRTTHLPYRFM